MEKKKWKNVEKKNVEKEKGERKIMEKNITKTKIKRRNDRRAFRIFPPAGTTALNGVQEQVTQTASITLYAGTTIIVSWVFRRVLSDIVDMVLKGLELKNALEKK